MKESTQTLAFLGAAIASVIAASWSRPTDVTYEVDKLIGQPLFAPFETEAAKSMRIVRFDEDTATLRDFEVAEDDGVWTIPSKGGYPADADRQMAEATTGVVGLDILDIASQTAADHAEYGVVEPSSSLEVGQSGVGSRVTLQDESGSALVDLVIGKEVKGSRGQRYVRKPSQDVVYVAAVDPTKFSTKFEDWIEDDLLKLSTWDISRVQVKDYSSQLVPQMTSRGVREVIAIDPRAEMTLDYDDKESKWVPRSLREYDRDRKDYVDFEIGEGRELDEETLREMKNALGDFKIVDVERKPAGLSGDLKAGADFFADGDAVNSLKDRGFAPTSGEGGTEILSTEGEVVVGMKDGVEYLLRFGNLQLAEGDDNAPAEDKDAAEGNTDDNKKKSSGVNRYLFVMARFNESMVPKPDLEELPAEEATHDDATENDAADADAKEESSDDGGAEEGSADEAEEKDAKKDSKPSREEVERRNKQKQDDYDKKIADAKKRVDELNDRFGDWYYVISDEVYKKVSLRRDQLVKAKAPDPDETEDQSMPAETKPGVPGLPNIPGVDFNPSAPADADAADVDAADVEAADVEAAEAAPTDAAEADTQQAETEPAEPPATEEPTADEAVEEQAGETPAPETPPAE